jgi:PAS domain S-box-containing protein
MTSPSSPAPARRPLKLLLFQPNRLRREQVVGELHQAGFDVDIDEAADLETFETRLREGSYDLAMNGLEFATTVQTLEQQRARAMETASEAALRIQAFFEACPLAIMSLDLEGHIVMWNRGAEQIFGWKAEEVLGKPLPTIPAGGEEDYAQLLKGQFSGTSHAGIQVRRQRKDGRSVDVSLYTIPLRHADGVIAGNVAVLAELSDAQVVQRRYDELVVQEAQIRHQADADRRFRQLLEAAPDGIVEMDAEGRIVLVNAVTEKLSGYSREELLGQDLEIMVPSELRGKHVHHRASFWSHPVTRPMGSGMTLNLQRKDKTLVPVEISLSPVSYDGAVRVTAIIRDITERKRAEQQIREVQQRLTAELTVKNQELELRNREIERANRLKTEFVASMSHELRTPLHTIIGFAELMAEELEGSLNPKQKRFVDHIYKDSLHLLELINDVLDISRIEAGHLELRLEFFDLTTAIEEVLATIRPQTAAKSLRLEASIVLGATVHADRVRFKEILYNLLSNAVKFTPQGGVIRVGAEVRDAFVEISVLDSGIGIPHEEQDAIFDKFYQVGSTTTGLREGTGLGLAITRQLVEAHGGRIRLRSAPGEGSQFFFSMPIEAMA